MSLVIIGQSTDLNAGTESFVSSIKDLWFAISASKEEKEKRWDAEAAASGNPKMATTEEILRDADKQQDALVAAVEDTFLNPRWIKSRTQTSGKIKVPAGLVINGKMLPIEELVKQTDHFSGIHAHYVDVYRGLEEMLLKPIEKGLSEGDVVNAVVKELNAELKSFSPFKLGNSTFTNDYKSTTAKSSMIEIDPIPLTEFNKYGRAFLRIIEEAMASYADQYTLEYGVDNAITQITFESDFDEKWVRQDIEHDFAVPTLKFMDGCIKQILEMVSAYWRILEASVEDVNVDKK